MNKDVIYIEPEDDITDIINRLGNSQQKVVALVPPKNLGILRSAVNTKLIAKTAKSKEKVAVFVTTDPSLVKLAMAAGIPVAKTLQSRPIVPTAEDVAKTAKEADDIIEEEIDETPAEPAEKKPKSAKKDVEKLNSADIEKDIEDSDKKDKKKGKQPKKSKIPSLDKYRKWIIIGAVAGVALIIFLVWAFVFAPHADIIVKMRTTANNFSEKVTFTTKESDAKPTEGKFYLEKQEDKETQTIEFKATGTKNAGDKATGTLTVSVTFDDEDSLTIPAGTTFYTGGHAYLSDSAASLSWNGKVKSCSAGLNADDTCTVSTSVSVTASAPGEDYNVGNSEWTSTLSGVSATGKASGGTTRNVTIVQQSDIDSAKEKIESDSADDAKKALVKKLSSGFIAVDSSFQQTTSDPVSTPAAGEEVADGVTPKLEVETTASIYGVDSSAVEKFIKKKADVASDQKIYSVGSPFFESFKEDGDNFSAKLKTTTQVGPKVTEEEILDKALGKKTGEVQTLIKSINGVSSVEVKTSFFWVTKVPSDSNKVTIEMKVEE